jgi:YVTN family beta-propeller protein/VCBS repeat-containing protein
MGRSKYIGRIGVLAVALGVGTAVATPAGFACAAPADTGGSANTAAGAGDAGSPTSSTAGTATASVPAGAESGPDSGDGESSTKRGADTSKTAPKPKKSSTPQRKARTNAETASAAQVNGTTVRPGHPSEPAQAAVHATSAIRVAAPVATIDVPSVVPTVMSAATVDRLQPAPAKPSVLPIGAIVNDVVGPILSSLFGAFPGGSTESPLAWLFLAAARRQIGQVPDVTQSTTAPAATTTSALVFSAAAVVAGPTVSPTFGTPDPVTGKVAGALNATDPSGGTLTYAVTSPPSSGKLTFNTTDATFTYTPTTAQRIAAGVTAGDDTTAMTVTVSDGTNTVPASVNIPVSPTSVAKAADIGVTAPNAVVATNTRVYVANKAAGTVTVIDATNNTVIGTIAVGATPDALTVKPDGTRLYVSSSAGNTVTVVNTGTNTVAATLAVAAPSAMAINASGSTVYVANFNAGTVTKITTSTNTLAGTVTLPAGFRPTGITVSPDKTKILVIGTNASGAPMAASFASSSTTATAINGIAGTPTGLAVSADSTKFYITSAIGTITVVNATTRAVLGTYSVGGALSNIAVSNDGSTLLVGDTNGNVTALNAATGAVLTTAATRSTTTAVSQQPSMALSPNGAAVYLTDYGANTVHVVSLLPADHPPTIGSITEGAPDPSTGAVTGAVTATDLDQDPLTYTVTGAPTKGSLVLNPGGTFTYTPTATARHAASTIGASTALTTDTFTISVSDGRGGTAASAVTVNISPTNTPPTIKTTSPLTSSTTGVVQAQVVGSDADKDPLTYKITATPTKGTVTLASGTYTYTPTAAARHAAASLTATTADKTDTFAITVSDGHGGTAATTVTVNISPSNSAPTGAKASITQTDATSGVVTGAVTATDANNDPLTVTSTTPTKGSIVINSNGTFTYTPTAAARQAASSPTATTSTKTDSVTFTVSDGYGGKTTVALALPVTPYPHITTPGNPGTPGVTTAIGQVNGSVTTGSVSGAGYTFTLTTQPTNGLVQVNSTTGSYTYVPNLSARYAAQLGSGPTTDSFGVTITDQYGASQTTTLSVPITPPSSSPYAIDQRSTTVAMNVQQMYNYTPTQVGAALDLLKADGVTTIRMLVPWAGVEPLNGVYNWTHLDAIVNGAAARNMQIDAVIDSTPVWALGPVGGLPVSGEPDPTAFGVFAGAMATRYAGKVSAYEIWNEANAVTFWTPAPDAVEYTNLLKAAYPAIKAADPNAEVVAAGLAAVISFAGATIDPPTFLSQMYAAGAQGYFDAVAYHPYSYTSEFSTPSPYPSAPINVVAALHNVMVANGDGNKQIWATEYGEPSSTVSEQSQAAYINDFLTTWRTLPYAGPAFIETLQDYSSSNADTASLGVYRSDWTPKPAVDVIEQVIQQNEAIIASLYV